MKARLNAQMAEGFEVVDVRLLPEDAAGAMSIVAAADYTCPCARAMRWRTRRNGLRGFWSFTAGTAYL